ncbi:hypothetical protein UFOVP1290_379 [uncultured Caudovirales phage]|uniref:Uncharacterized protein n=1 Tax=uncultured Caudovirales phage TaxID=2100421 RepID=A0A6J5RIN9_9CAUD|nr:hypothetical protein UFOVP1290_379 [uncultured Caudovirales phage]
MKTKTLHFKLITHSRKRSWRWMPLFFKSQVIYVQDGKTWLAPLYEVGWLFFVFDWVAYDLRKEHGLPFDDDHECPAELMQIRINELESAIRNHKKFWNKSSSTIDNELWKLIND